jgi:Zn-finger nucleic acid-binding protein
MDCPKCLGRLQEVEVGEMENKSVMIDQCQLCGGIWFDKGELAKVLQLKVKFVETPEEFENDLKGSVLDRKVATCPRCKKEMFKISAPNDDRIKMDYCLDCDGAWLDPGELAVIQRGNIIERALRAVRNKFSGAFASRGNSYRPMGY